MPQRVTYANVSINAERCKGCGLCVFFCPKSIIGMASHVNQMGYNPAVVIEEKAHEFTGCIACAIMCPDTAISVYRPSGNKQDNRVAINS